MLLGNDKPCRVQGIGTVRIKMHNEVEKVLINVRFIHELKRNLISLGMLDDLGYVIRVESRILKIRGLTKLSKEGFLGDEKVQEMEFCEACVYGKSYRVKFGTGVHRTKGTLDYLKVFGCITYAHIRQDKLEPRALKCVFLGYLEGVKAYKLWCLEPGIRKCIVSRDVVFN